MKAKQSRNRHNISHNNSSTNINDEANSTQTNSKSTKKLFFSNKKTTILILTLIGVILIGLTISLIYISIIRPNKAKKIIKTFDKTILTNEPYEEPEYNNNTQSDIFIKDEDDDKDKININETKLVFTKEELAVQRTYPKNRIFVYSNEHVTKMKIEGEKINKENSTQFFNKTSDFIFITRSEFLEKDTESLVEKQWYTGYLAILDLIVPNGTYNNCIIYDEKINNYLYKKKRILDNLNDSFAKNEGNFCFAKIEFYHNGEIKNIFLPHGFNLGLFSYIEEYLKLLLPKISSNLYVDNIENEINNMVKKSDEDDNNYNSDNIEPGIFEENINITDFTLRNLNSDFNKKNNSNIKQKYYKNKYLKRVLSDSYTINTDNNSSNYSEISVICEDFKTQPFSKSINYDLRQVNKNNENDYSTDYKSDFMESDIISFSDNYFKDNNDSNLVKLTQLSINSIESEDLKMEGGVANTTINYFLDEEGFLKSVYEKSISLMKSPEDNGGENDEETESLYNEVYNNDNLISKDDILDKNGEGQSKNNISFGISYLSANSSNIINCTEHFINEEINKKLYNYFDSFTYEIYDNNKNSTYDSDNNDLNNNISDIRYLSETENSNDTYYGMKKIIHIKQLYKYNIIGIKMQGYIYNEINPSDGRMDVYAVIGFGNLNTRIKIKEQISNYHIILDRSNKMGYNLLLLINQTNNELIERNKKYSEIILEFEKNFTHFFEKYCDYSNLFNESLINMYNQVQNFSGEFFYQLIDLINRVYNNYSIILEDVKLGEYDFINKIRNITKDEYIKYIYNQLETLENFENKTLSFLDNLENELNNIKDFQVDVLYDIIDSISDSKQIFKK